MVDHVKEQLKKGQEILPEQMEYLKKATKEKPRLIRQLHEMREEREKLLMRIDKNRNACIRVEGVVYSGVEVTVKEVRKIQHDQVSRCKFVRDGADVKMIGL